jgi:hypothetical protein
MQLVIPEREFLEADAPAPVNEAASELLELARQVPRRPDRYRTSSANDRGLPVSRSAEYSNEVQQPGPTERS